MFAKTVGEENLTVTGLCQEALELEWNCPSLWLHWWLHNSKFLTHVIVHKGESFDVCKLKNENKINNEERAPRQASDPYI